MYKEVGSLGISIKIAPDSSNALFVNSLMHISPVFFGSPSILKSIYVLQFGLYQLLGSSKKLFRSFTCDNSTDLPE